MNNDIAGNGNQVVLPFDKEQFAGFITSLLGRPQKIEQKFAFPFEFSSQDVTDTFNLVEQRVHDQNRANLIQFSVDVSYNDGSSVTHSCLEDFLSYKEVKPLIPSALTMSWTYLITFQNRAAPEKQEIEVSYISHASHFSPEYSYKGLADYWFAYAVGMSGMKINHTSRSWGSDIESLLTNHMSTYEKTEPGYRKWFRRNNGRVSTAFFLSILFLGLVGLLTTTYILTEEDRLSVEHLLAKDTVSTLDQKVNFLIKNSLLGEWPRYFFSAFLFVVVLIVGAVFGSIAMGKMSEYKEPSFILISKTAEKHKNHIDIKLSKSWKKYFGVLVGGIITGVVANIIFTLIWLP